MSAPSPGTSDRTLTIADRFIVPLDDAIRTLFAPSRAHRASPGSEIQDIIEQPENRPPTAALMRINHSGEIAAQALYRGHALVARTHATRAAMQEAGNEETDHLAWCEIRIKELGGRTSALNPLWYAGAFAIGAMVGLAGDRISLGFVGETERQVAEHLEGHLQRLPRDDARTRAIIAQMRVDEERHGRNAMSAGGAHLPAPARALMKTAARVMTLTARWV